MLQAFGYMPETGFNRSAKPIGELSSGPVKKQEGDRQRRGASRKARLELAARLPYMRKSAIKLLPKAAVRQARLDLIVMRHYAAGGTEAVRQNWPRGMKRPTPAAVQARSSKLGIHRDTLKGRSHKRTREERAQVQALIAELYAEHGARPVVAQQIAKHPYTRNEVQKMAKEMGIRYEGEHIGGGGHNRKT